MTDERIKEEFEKWMCASTCCTDDERRFYEQFNSEMHPISVGFYAGFNTAERLEKIEALDEALNELQSSDSNESFERSLNSMIAELKEANR